MKKYGFSELLHLLGVPALTVVLGLVLLLNPDSAAALAGRVLGGILVLVGVGFCFRAYRKPAGGRTGSVILAVVLLAAGAYFAAKPLSLAASLGRIIGILLLLRGCRNLLEDFRAAGRLTLRRGTLISGLTALAGLVLVLLPLATSRMLFSICGIVLICVGCAEGIDRLRDRNYLEQGDDPNIIDAL